MTMIETVKNIQKLQFNELIPNHFFNSYRPGVVATMSLQISHQKIKTAIPKPRNPRHACFERIAVNFSGVISFRAKTRLRLNGGVVLGFQHG